MKHKHVVDIKDFWNYALVWKFITWEFPNYQVL